MRAALLKLGELDMHCIGSKQHVRPLPLAVPGERCVYCGTASYLPGWGCQACGTAETGAIPE